MARGWRRRSDAELAAIAGKAVKEARYHQQHAGDWVVRLGDGTDGVGAPHARRAGARLALHAPRCSSATRSTRRPRPAASARARDALRAPGSAEVGRVSSPRPGWRVPADTPFCSTGTRAAHSEHMGFILAEMQALQRQLPGGRW